MKPLCLILLMFSVAVPISLLQGSPPATAVSLTGTWEGRFSSRNFASFPVTLLVNEGVGGKLTGAVNLISSCLRNANLEITIEGSNVVLAGQDPEGDTITFEGSLNEQATQLTMSYVLNGSASGRCETDDGSGTLDKR